MHAIRLYTQLANALAAWIAAPSDATRWRSE